MVSSVVSAFGGPPNNDVPQKSGGNTPGVLAGVDINIPPPDDFTPDPVGTRAFVEGSLKDMTQGF